MLSREQEDGPSLGTRKEGHLSGCPTDAVPPIEHEAKVHRWVPLCSVVKSHSEALRFGSSVDDFLQTVQSIRRTSVTGQRA